MTVKEASFELGVSQNRVRQMITSGQLSADRKGGRWEVKAESIPGAKDRKNGRPAGPYRDRWSEPDLVVQKEDATLFLQVKLPMHTALMPGAAARAEQELVEALRDAGYTVISVGGRASQVQ